MWDELYIYRRPRVNAFAPRQRYVMARETARCGSLHFTCAAALRTSDNGARREQWRERDTALRYVRPPRISQSALRTYVRTPEGFVGGVVDAERCVVRFVEKMADSYRRRTTYRAARGGFILLMGRGYFIVLAKARGTPCVE